MAIMDDLTEELFDAYAELDAAREEQRHLPTRIDWWAINQQGANHA